MDKNIDQLTLEIASTISNDVLYKGMSPLVAARFRAWIKSIRGKNNSVMPIVQKAIIEKIENHIAAGNLQKNEVMASAYQGGTVRLDFGSDVPEKIKKAAMQWAKKKGLKAVEASLTKNNESNSWMVFTKSDASIPAEDSCVGRYKIAITN